MRTKMISKGSKLKPIGVQISKAQDASKQASKQASKPVQPYAGLGDTNAYKKVIDIYYDTLPGIINIIILITY